MHHIIDGNNLAGKLELLNKKNFDQVLAGILRVHYHQKKIKVHLVFDGRDALGDCRAQGCFKIIYTPIDDYYRSADDKIVEIIAMLGTSEKDELLLITNDNELIARARNAAERTGRKLEIMHADAFAQKLLIGANANVEDEMPDEKIMDARQTKKINDELLKLWT